MKRRIFWSILLSALGSILLLGACVVGLEYQDSSRDAWENLAARAYYFAGAIEDAGPAYLEKVRGYSGRVTLVDADGTVLFDDRELAANMENHADRPEIQEALQTGVGQEERMSGTVGERTLYYALRLPNGQVLRTAETDSSVIGESLRILPWVLAVIGVLAVAAAGIARWQTGAIVRPINKLDLNHPLQAEAYGELAPLLRRISAQKSELHRQVEELRRRQDEFDTVTRSMDEGLVVLDRDGMVLSLNESVRGILDLPGAELTGRHILMLSRNVLLEKAIRGAADGSKVKELIELGGKKYQVTASPSVFGGEVQGIVLLFLDETDRVLAEEKRREFSANVSHELKTPLTSISGYAEIIHNGLAKPEDAQKFAGCIYEEANRLISLVEDIIRLSRLDEKAESLAKSPVDLYQLAQKTVQSLAQTAQDAQLAVAVEGESAAVNGVASILGEVLYNLVDNAIRYSDKGRITVRVKKDGKDAAVSVADEGIGIPKEHQDQIFERFYRVDKSHSRGSGGTGLGLAIVKRGVLFHGGSVGLQSKPGQGSVFTFTIPLDGGETP